MTFKLLDGVQQFATGTGVGGLTLGTVTSLTYRSMPAAGMNDGDTTRVRIQHATLLTEWEVVFVEYNDGGISRTKDSKFFSSTGDLIEFSAGDKIVSSVVISKDYSITDEDGNLLYANGDILGYASGRIGIGSGNPPVSSSAPGEPGQMEYDNNYLYICTAVNVWRRIAHSTF